MAGLFFVAKPALVTISTGAGPITLFQIVAPSNQRVIIPEVLFSFNGVTAADPPVLIEALYQTTAGSSVSLTLLKWNNSDSESIQSTALQTFSGEPSAGNVIWGDYIHMQTGDREKPVSVRIPGFTIPGGSRLGFRYTSGTVTGTVKCQPWALCEE